MIALNAVTCFKPKPKRRLRCPHMRSPSPLQIGINTAKPVLLSCLEPVIEGFHTVYDLDGVAHFIDTTTG